MRYYEVSPVIASSPETARSDGAAWPSWGSGAGGVDSWNAPGQKITIGSRLAPGRAFPVEAREEYAGPLPGWTWRSMPDLGPSFGRFARGLKRRAGAGH